MACGSRLTACGLKLRCGWVQALYLSLDLSLFAGCPEACRNGVPVADLDELQNGNLGSVPVFPVMSNRRGWTAFGQQLTACSTRFILMNRGTWFLV
jgi:hypothetical protein